jgi:hypothetical protein
VANRFVVTNGSDRQVLDTGNDVQFEESLKRMTTPLFGVPTLGERLADADKSYATLSAGTSGGGRLINIAAEKTGAFRLAMRRPEAAVPAGIMTDITKRLGPLPDYALPAVDWISYAVNCYLDFIEPELAPDVMLLWLCEPDETFHQRGIGSPDSLTTIRHVDAEFGRILGHHERQIADGVVQVVALSDHGQISVEGEPMDLAGILEEAGFGAAASGLDAVVANAGGLWLREPTPEAIGEIAAWLQCQEWCGPLFTRDGLAGTLRHAQIGLEHNRAPDIALALQYGHGENEWGREGISRHASRYPPGCGCHGGLSIHEMHNFIAMGGGVFGAGREIGTPAGNVDILPTILHLLGLEHPQRIDGRILHEALAGWDGDEGPTVEERVVRSTNRSGAVTKLSVSHVGDTSYINFATTEK